jgi:ABC-type sugar transport system ATPase subunit
VVALRLVAFVARGEDRRNDGAAEMTALLEVRDVSKAFGATQALRGVSLTVSPGEIHGLCGRNGAGKSTLVKILTGIEQPDAGIVRFQGEEVRFHRPRDAQAAGIAVIDQELSVVPVLTVEENVRLGAIDTPFMRRRNTSRRVRALLDRVGLTNLSPSSPVEHLSMAERQLVEIARLLDRDASLLLLDEPTASLSLEDSLIVFDALRKLASEGTGVLYVSHRLGEVLDLCSQVTVLRDGAVVADKPTAALDHDSLVNLIVGEFEQDRFESGRRELDRAEGRDSASHASGTAVTIEHVAVPSKVVAFSLSILPGQVVALAGQVGSGTREVLRALAGLEPDARVAVTYSGRPLRVRRPSDALAAGIFYISNDRKNEGLFLSRSVEQNLLATRLKTLSKLGYVAPRVRRKVGRELASQVAVDPGMLSRPVAALSGGNQQKVFIGRCLDRRPTRLLLLDEPTRGVDAAGRESIHGLIRRASAQDAAVLFTSGEPDEVLELADVVVSFQHGTVVSIRSRSEVTEDRLLADTTQSRVAQSAELNV